MKLRGGSLGTGDRWIADVKSDGWTELEVEREDGTWVSGMLDPGARLVSLVTMIEHMRGNEDGSED